MRWLLLLLLHIALVLTAIATGIFACMNAHCMQGDTRLIVDDIKALQPTIFPSVPRLLNRMHDKVSITTYCIHLYCKLALYPML
jgi:long-subunit acyl-CoA synthetase (AMP-forming)